MTQPKRDSRRDHYRGRDVRRSGLRRQEPARAGSRRTVGHVELGEPGDVSGQPRDNDGVGSVRGVRRAPGADQRLGPGAPLAWCRLGLCIRYCRLGTCALADDKACAQVYGALRAGSRLSPDRVQSIGHPRRRSSLALTLRCRTGSRFALLRQARRRLCSVQVAR
jgi:hypothetical protein